METGAMKKFLLLTVMLLSGLLLAEGLAPEKGKDAAGGPDGQPQMRPERGRRGGAPAMKENIIKRMRESAATLVKKYDADGDGKLNETEKAALEKDMKLVEELFPISITYKRLKVIDKDGDLQISDEEADNLDMEAIREKMQRNRGNMGPNRPERPAPRNPNNKNGKPEAEDED